MHRLPRQSRMLVYLVPVIWCVAVWAVMRPDAIAVRPGVPDPAKWLIYDESDLTAFAMRGANFADGRLPGRLDEPYWLEPNELSAQLDDPNRPKSQRFFFEYPLPALAIFRLAYAFHPPPELPAAVGDGQQYAISQHLPRNEREVAVWTALRSAVRLYLALATVALTALLLLLMRGIVPGEPARRWLWLAVLPGATYFSLHRFDIYPTLLTACAFAALARNRPGWSGVFLAGGVLLKLYPVLFVPVIVRYLGARLGTRFVLTFSLVILSGFGIAWALTDWQSLTGPIRVQMSRELEIGWTLYDKMLPAALGRSGTARLIMLGLITLACIYRRPETVADVLRRCGLILIAFVAMAVFWSPQWMLWLMPILVPLAARSRPVAYATVALDLITYCSFPVMFWVLWSELPKSIAGPLARDLTYARGIMWIVLAIVLFRVRASDSNRLSTGTIARVMRTIIDAGNSGNSPRGLRWITCEINGEPVFVNDGERVVLIPFLVTFEPIAGSEMEGIEAATIPRPVTAVVRFRNGEWILDRAPVFNLSPEELIARSGGRFR
jgi:hypothetical protein